MKKLCRRACALALTVLLTLSLSLPALAAEPETAEEAGARAAAAAMTYGGAASIQYALWQDGEITLTGHAGVYSKTENRALTDDVLYGIGSVSKVLTTAAVMQLAEEGQVSLDAPVTRYLPEFTMADPRYRDITVRMLLNHSSGLMGSSLESAVLFDDADPAATDTLLQRLSSQRLKADPGAYSVYCNDGFTLAELVVEAVSGMDFMDYVDRNLLAPAGISDIFAPGDDFDASRLAKTYVGTDTRALPQECLNAVGAGGMYATASALAAFGGALTDTALLTQRSLDAMAAPEYHRGIWPEDTLDALAFGLGWDNVEWYPFCQSGISALTKGGDTLYYHAALVVLPEHDMAAAVLTSGGSSTYNQLAATEILLAALAEEGVTVDTSIPALPEAAPAQMPAGQLDYAGYYGSTAAQYRVGITADGTLTLSYLNLPDIPDQVFAYCSDGSFRDASGAALLRFVEESNGETYLYQKAVSPIPELGALPTSSYAAVKLADNALDPAVQAVWDQVAVTSILPVTEKYTSTTYLALSANAAAAASETLPEMVPGYIGASRILSQTSARYDLQLPGVGGRDGQEWTLLERDGGTWLQVNNALYMPEDQAPDLYAGGGWSYATVGQEGYAKWYHVGDTAGKTMTVQLPASGGFWIYDGQGRLTASSVLWGDTSAVLPEDGMVVFAGDAGVRFHLRFA